MTRLLYDKVTAAEQLSISERVLARLIADGEIESVLVGRRRLVRDSGAVHVPPALRAQRRLRLSG